MFADPNDCTKIAISLYLTIWCCASHLQAVRWGHWQNWFAGLMMGYDLFSMMSLIVQPEVQYPESEGLAKVFSEKWQTLGFDTLTEDFTNGTPGFWLSFTLAAIWLFFAFFSYFIYDIQQNTGALMTNRRFKTAMSLLPNSLFFFITLNLLQALRFPNSPSSPLYSAPETAQVGF